MFALMFGGMFGGRKPPLLLIAAGGTGGHMFPAQALAEEMGARGWRVALMSDSRGLGYSGGFPSAVRKIQIASATFSRGGLMARGLVPLTIARGVLSALGFMVFSRPAVVVGFGGYPSIPALFAGGLTRRPRIIHEQNAVLGRVNRRFAGRVDVVTHALPLVAPPQGIKTFRLGNPLRKAIAIRQGAGYIAPGNWPMKVLIIGGSQGAAGLGAVVAEAIARLSEATRQRLTVIHQVRTDDILACQGIYEAAEIRCEVGAFFDNIGDHLAECQLVISRAGASSISEIAAIGRPSILVPLPTAMDDHQSANARCLAELGAAKVFVQDEMTATSLKKAIANLLDAPTKATKMAEAALGLAKPEATMELAALVENLANLRKPAPQTDSQQELTE